MKVGWAGSMVAGSAPGSARRRRENITNRCRVCSQMSSANLGLSYARNTGEFVLTDEKNESIPCSRKTKYNCHWLFLDGYRDTIWGTCSSLSIQSQQDTC